MSSGNGTPGHVGFELFKVMTGTQIVHVPYKGGAAAIGDLATNQVQLMLEGMNSITPHAKSGRVRALAVQTFRALSCEGLARVDVFLAPDGAVYVNEINTMPGFTAISMFPKLWAASGVDAKQLVARLVDLALERAARRGRLRTSV
jgi:hypothetical protein